jgi:3',5'-cyclic AMP phosphodiesterase CpdA
MKDGFLIAQLSDIHCGDPRFDEKLLNEVVLEVNSSNPGLVVVPGDLTAYGYRDQFEEAEKYLQLIQCKRKVIVAGNHNCQNVGYLHFEDIFGPRYYTQEFHFDFSLKGNTWGKVKVVAVDSNKPDLDDGEVGREKYKWILKEFSDDDYFKNFVLHHLVSIPGTGRKRNIVWDAGD